ncbi:uncharacterized protein ACRADG_002512 isoform 1-T4 [Cochliomyia hominivorax]
MKFCNFCATNSEQVKNINKEKITINNNLIIIKEILNIFHQDLVKFLLINKTTLICHTCLKQLKNSYKFIQLIKESENKFILAKDIKTEHDYFEADKFSDNQEQEISHKQKGKIVVKTEKLEENSSSLKFKTILPKSSKEENKRNETLSKSRETKTRFYKCLQCKELFKSFKNLIEHERELCENQISRDLKICQYCHKCFLNENSLNEHKTLKHPNEEFICCLCEDKEFVGKGYLARHLEKTHQQEYLQYFCGACPKLICLATQTELRAHMVENHANDTTLSNLDPQSCSELNDDDMDLEMHEEFLDEFLLAHTNENSFQFSECWEALDLHLPDMLQSAGTNLPQVAEFCEAFSCPKCFEQFKKPQPLLRHLAEIHDLPVLQCRVCRKCFTSFKDFKRHKLQQCLKHSNLNSSGLECPYCSKLFKSNIHLKQHIRIVHCQLKRHICQLCDKQFSTLDHLKKHVLSQHQNERKHVCMVCDKSFTQLGHLKQHLAIHTTGKTVQCKECPLKFWRKIDLEKHKMKTHVGGITATSEN